LAFFQVLIADRVQAPGVRSDPSPSPSKPERPRFQDVNESSTLE
jgi:hypothetical protein